MDALRAESPLAHRRRTTLFHVVLIVAVTGSIYFANLGGAKLWDRDEPRNAGCAREMLQRGDWVTPYFNGQLRTHKPVLTYWLMMLSYGLFGVSEFAARFWSAALGIGTSLATYVIARRLFSATAALWSALAMGTSLLFCVASRAATPDAVLIFCSTMAIMCYVVGTFRRKDHGEDNTPPHTHLPGRLFPNWPMAAVMYAWMALAVLAKGPVGVILPTAVIGMFLLLMRLPRGEKQNLASRPAWTRWHSVALLALAIELFIIDRALGGMKAYAALAVAITLYGLWQPASLSRRLIRPFAPRHFLRTCWAMRPLTALAVALAIAAPWYVWVGLRTDGAWLEGFFLTHNLGRATQSFEGHTGTYLFYPVSAFAGLFPWSILLLPAVFTLVQHVRRRDNWMVGYIFLACWIGVYGGIFSLAKTKLPSYITPAYPALAMIVAAYVVSWSQGRIRPSAWTPWVAYAALAIVGIGICIGLPIAARQLLPNEMWLGVFGVVPLIAAAGGYFFASRGRPISSAATLATCAALLPLIAFGYIAPRVSQHQPVERLLQHIAASSHQPALAAHRTREPSWVFYSGQPIPTIGHRNRREIETFLQNPDAFLITSQRAVEGLECHFPPDVKVIARERAFLRDHNLVVIGRTRAGVRAARGQSPPTRLR